MSEPMVVSGVVPISAALTTWAEVSGTPPFYSVFPGDKQWPREWLTGWITTAMSKGEVEMVGGAVRLVSGADETPACKRKRGIPERVALPDSWILNLVG